MDIEGFLLVHGAQRGVIGQDGDILPDSWVPVWVIVSLFGAFESISVSVVVLSGVLSSLSIEISISNVKSLVSFSGSAVLV